MDESSFLRTVCSSWALGLILAAARVPRSRAAGLLAGEDPVAEDVVSASSLPLFLDRAGDTRFIFLSRPLSGLFVPRGDRRSDVLPLLEPRPSDPELSAEYVDQNASPVSRARAQCRLGYPNNWSLIVVEELDP